uniref:Uncharacterized protein LOC114335241 isoform X1 n=1 Tax=Diabrotica virgifera virgifera TaxID=50390 RepID=A0A6P7FXG4_DIAVI
METNYPELNINRICRICLNEYPMMKHLFQDNLAEIVQSITTLQIHQYDALPNLICSYCFEDVKQFNIFRNKALENDRLLQAVLKAQVTYTENVYYENQNQEDNSLYNNVGSTVQLENNVTTIIQNTPVRYTMI